MAWGEKVGLVARNNESIGLYARHLLNVHGNNKEQYGHICEEMRRLASLLIALRQHTGKSGATLEEFIDQSKDLCVYIALKIEAGTFKARTSDANKVRTFFSSISD